MARAGYCSGCGAYVYLRPDGACVNGHDPAYVSGIYEAPDELAPPAAFASQAPQPYAAPQPQPQAYAQQPAQQAYAPQGYAQQPAQPYTPQPQAYAQPAPAPRKSRVGLIVALLVVALLACGGLAGGLVFFGIVPNPADMLASPEHQKVAVAGEFVEAFLTANPVLFRKTLPTDAANAADPVFWVSKLAEAAGEGRVESKTWNGDTLTIVAVSKDGEKREFVLTAGDGDKVTALSRDVGETDGDPAVLTMVKEIGGWKVLAMGSDTEEFIRFTPEAIKQFEQENK